MYKNILECLDVGVAIIRNGKYLSHLNLAFKDFLSLKDEIEDTQSLLSLIDSDSISIENFKIFINSSNAIKKSFILNLNTGLILGCNLKRLSTSEEETLDLLTIQDITSQELLIKQLTIESQQDELTGIANRRKFEVEFSKLYDFAKRSNSTGALMLLDLNNFKSINDRYGHTTGDRILKQVCLALASTIRSYELLARVGGDEFAILVSNSGEQAIERLIKEVPLALKTVKINANNEDTAAVTLQISMGTCIFPLPDKTRHDIYDIADKNMYEYKMITRN